MKFDKKKILKTVGSLLIAFVVVNAGWYGWRALRYAPYSKGCEKNDLYSVIVPRYIHTDEDGYDYAVKYPGYMSFTGNMCVTAPATEEDPYLDFLIIWPKAVGGYEYGVGLIIDGVEYQIYINADGTPVDPEDSELVASRQDTVNALLDRANEMWDLN